MRRKRLIACGIIGLFALLGFGFLSLDPLRLPYYLKSLSGSAPSSDCGPKSLQVVLQHFGIEASLDQLREMTGVTEKGTSLLALRNAAQQFGLTAEGWMVSPGDLETVQPPAIVFISGHHFSVLSAVSSDTVSLNDPDRGILRISKNNFFRIWEGQALLFAPPGQSISLGAPPVEGEINRFHTNGGSL